MRFEFYKCILHLKLKDKCKCHITRPYISNPQVVNWRLRRISYHCSISLADMLQNTPNEWTKLIYANRFERQKISTRDNRWINVKTVFINSSKSVIFLRISYLRSLLQTKGMELIHADLIINVHQVMEFWCGYFYHKLSKLGEAKHCLKYVVK